MQQQLLLLVLMLVMNDAGADGGTSYDVDVETEGRGLLPTTGQRLIRTRYMVVRNYYMIKAC